MPSAGDGGAGNRQCSTSCRSVRRPTGGARGRRRDLHSESRHVPRLRRPRRRGAPAPAHGLPRRRGVFQRSPGPVPLSNNRAWGAYVPGASWRSPQGPGSDVASHARHPVTHVAFEDAQAYAAWPEGASDGGGMGVRGAGRARRSGVRLGRRDAGQRQAARELLAGRLPMAQRRGQRLARDLAGRLISSKWLLAL
jgi:hypothetical protein